MILKTFKSFSILTIIISLFFISTVALNADDARKEIPSEIAQTLIEAREFFAKDIRFCWNEAGGQFCNDINMNDVGSIYLTEMGIIHQGKVCYFIRWQDIKKVAKPAGQPDSIRLWTTEPTEKLIITDFMRTGSSSTLDTGLDNLLHATKKYFKQYKGLSPKKLPVLIDPATTPQTPPPPPPPAQVKSEPALKTVDIKTGMSPEEIEKKMGPPLKRIILDSKTIYQYKDMVLTFIEGKLTDVEMK